jgi:hypothetical protein
VIAAIQHKVYCKKIYGDKSLYVIKASGKRGEGSHVEEK